MRFASAAEFRDEAKSHKRRAGEVGKEDEANAAVEMLVCRFQPGVRAEEHGQAKKYQQVKQYVRDDERKLQRHELDGPALKPEFGEHDGLEGVKGHDNRHAAYILRMGGVSHGSGNRLDQQQHRRYEQQAHASDHFQRGPVDFVAVFSVFVGKAEHGGFHSEGQESQQQCSIGIEIRNYAVAAAGCRNLISIQRYKQIVQEPADYAAKPVNRGIFCQRLEIHHGKYTK